MKENKVKRKKTAKVFVAIVAIVILAAAAIGVTAAYSKLREIWIRQCQVTDVTAQVQVNDGNMIKAGTVLSAFGIKNGTNLALIDFDRKRSEILKRYPCIKSITVTRHLPNRVSIAVEERRALVRLDISGGKSTAGRVADSEGMVFVCRRGTGLLPTIRERKEYTTPTGQFLSGRSLAALQLIIKTANDEFAALKVQDADTAKQDFILLTFADYVQAKIAWEGMDTPTKHNDKHLELQLRHLLKAMESNVGSSVKMWNATVSDRIYADAKETIK